MIPAFGDDGNLPVGIHEAIWEELCERFGVTPHRRRLLAGLEEALQSLKRAGCCAAYLGGSFVTAKEVPADFDVCWDLAGVDPNLLDPVLLMFQNGRAAQKAKFGGELFPSSLPASASGSVFLEFFQIDKESGERKGIVALDLRRLS